MANLNESTTYDANVASIDLTDDVVGADTAVDPNTGVANIPHVNLTNRTNYLKAVGDLHTTQITSLGTSKANLAGAAFIGDVSLAAGKQLLVNKIKAFSGAVIDMITHIVDFSIIRADQILKRGTSLNVEGVTIQSGNVSTAAGSVLSLNTRGYIDGLRNIWLTDTTFQVGAGVCSDLLNQKIMSTTAFSKDAVSTWASGSTNGALVEGTAALPGAGLKKWFYVFIFSKTNGTVDIALDSDKDGANIATNAAVVTWGGVSAKRRVGAINIEEDTGYKIIPFKQKGDYFRYLDPQRVANAQVIGATDTTVTAEDAPYEVCDNVTLLHNITYTNGGAGTGVIYVKEYDFVTGEYLIFTSDAASAANSHDDFEQVLALDPSDGSFEMKRGGTAATGAVLYCYVRGWVDLRGKEAA